MQDPDIQFLSSILANCEGRKECVGCQNYFLCYPWEASPEVKKLQKDKIKRFKKAMRKLDKASEFFPLFLDELHKAL
jgi:hypothetical protein